MLLFPPAATGGLLSGRRLATPRTRHRQSDIAFTYGAVYEMSRAWAVHAPFQERRLLWVFPAAADDGSGGARGGQKCVCSALQRGLPAAT